MKDVIALLDCHNSPELGELTSSRPLASTSFLGRYALMDFMMSNFTNSGIDNVGILCRNHQRSLLKHMGNMSSWVSNTKLGRTIVFYNEKGVLNETYNTDLSNIRENDWVLYDEKVKTIVIAAPHILASIDFAPILERHLAGGEDITVLYKDIGDADKTFLNGNLLEVDKEGYVLSSHRNDGKKKKAKASLEAWILSRDVLAEMIDRYPRFDASFGIREMLESFAKERLYKIRAVPFEGYVRCVDSLEHYLEYSFELLNPKVASGLFNPAWPIFTLTHDTPPALYGPNSEVSNSFVSNGCVIDGKVKDSIICRNVKIGKGSVIRHSILLSGVTIGENAKVSDVLIDKYSHIIPRHTIEGDEKNVIYVGQGASL